jgi:hypothetical protein
MKRVKSRDCEDESGCSVPPVCSARSTGSPALPSRPVPDEPGTHVQTEQVDEVVGGQVARLDMLTGEADLDEPFEILPAAAVRARADGP